MQPLQPLLINKLEAQLCELGERLSLARRRRRIPQRELARHVGVTVVTLRKLERGHGGVSLATLVKALAAVGLGDQVDQLAAADRLGRKLLGSAFGRPRPACAPATLTRRSGLAYPSAASCLPQETTACGSELARDS